MFHVFSPQVNNLVRSFGCGYSLLFFILTNCQSGRPVSFFFGLTLPNSPKLLAFYFNVDEHFYLHHWLVFHIIIKNKKIVEWKLIDLYFSFYCDAWEDTNSNKQGSEFMCVFVLFLIFYFFRLIRKLSSINQLTQFLSSLRACIALNSSSFVLRNSSICLARCSRKSLSCSSMMACSCLSVSNCASMFLCLSSFILSLVMTRSWASLTEEIVCSNVACSSVVRFRTWKRYWNGWQL